MKVNGIEVTAVHMTSAAEEAALQSQAKAQFHAIGEELVRQASAILMVPMDVAHLMGIRIAGEITARGNDTLFRVRRAFADIGAEMEIRIGNQFRVIPNRDLCDIPLIHAQVREMALVNGISSF